MIKINGHILEPTIFPDKTSQVWKIPNDILTTTHGIDILWDFDTESELFHLCQLVDLLKSVDTWSGFLSLHIPYLPYGRQDKEISNESTSALRTFAKIINSLGFDYVSTKDAHSSIAKELIDNLDDIFPMPEIKSVLDKIESPVIAYPDHGAYLRYSLELKEFDKDSIIGTKKRNQLTGYIEKYDIEGDCEGKNIVIIDDICDGGMTFRLLTKDLLKNGAKSVILYVTHGIFSRGLEVLKDDGIDRIFTHKGEVK
jgi:ribose-phosphate pyrophosphokinase